VDDILIFLYILMIKIIGKWTNNMLD
jgi:hypothetical protein